MPVTAASLAALTLIVISSAPVAAIMTVAPSSTTIMIGPMAIPIPAIIPAPIPARIRIIIPPVGGVIIISALRRPEVDLFDVQHGIGVLALLHRLAFHPGN